MKWHRVHCALSGVHFPPIFFQLITEDKYEVMQFMRDACIMIRNAKQPALNLTIHLTSPVVREEAEKQAAGGTLTLFRGKELQWNAVRSKPGKY